MKYLITGGCGFIGSNLAKAVLDKGRELCVFDNLSRLGCEKNLAWLQSQGLTNFRHGDIRSIADVEPLISEYKPDVIFHLAGQVAMTTSLNNPRKDFEINVVGGINLLESVRKYSPKTIITYSSTNKVYGDLELLKYRETSTRYVVDQYPEGFAEDLSLDFRTPYGCSKGAVDQYMTDYAKVFGLRTVVFRHSSVFGGRQFSSYDQGWIGWFVQRALALRDGSPEEFTISGDGKQVRDVLFIDDLIRCYFAAVEKIDRTAGRAYNIGGGMQNSLSLLELFQELETLLNVKMRFKKLAWRSSDQKVFVANTNKARQDFDWAPSVSKLQGLKTMVKWVQEANGRNA